MKTYEKCFNPLRGNKLYFYNTEFLKEYLKKLCEKRKLNYTAFSTSYKTKKKYSEIPVKILIKIK